MCHLLYEILKRKGGSIWIDFPSLASSPFLTFSPPKNNYFWTILSPLFIWKGGTWFESLFPLKFLAPMRMVGLGWGSLHLPLRLHLFALSSKHRWLKCFWHLLGNGWHYHLSLLINLNESSGGDWPRLGWISLPFFVFFLTSP